VANHDISALIKDLRRHLGLTQEQLAQELGVTFSTVNQWENGHRRPQPFLRKRLLEMKASLDKVSTSTLIKAQARLVQNGWQTGKTADNAEFTTTPMVEKFRQMAKLMVSAQELAWAEGQATEEEEIRQRWMRLWRVLHG
jgi:transcriptional regulator with XRE-family HTH domain